MASGRSMVTHTGDQYRSRYTREERDQQYEASIQARREAQEELDREGKGRKITGQTTVRIDTETGKGSVKTKSADQNYRGRASERARNNAAIVKTGRGDPFGGGKSKQAKAQAAAVRAFNDAEVGTVFGRTDKGTVYVKVKDDSSGKFVLEEKSERLYPSVFGLEKSKTKSVSGFLKIYDKDGNLKSQEFDTDTSVRQLEPFINRKGESVTGATYTNEFGVVESLPESYFARPTKQRAGEKANVAEDLVTIQTIQKATAEAKAQGGELRGFAFTFGKTGNEKSSSVDVDYSGLTPQQLREKGIEFEYENPTYNLMFGNKRIGDFITEEQEKGDKGLYGSRTYIDTKDANAFMKSYSEYLTEKENAEKYVYVQPDPTNPFNIVRLSRDRTEVVAPDRRHPFALELRLKDDVTPEELNLDTTVGYGVPYRPKVTEAPRPTVDLGTGPGSGFATYYVNQGLSLVQSGQELVYGRSDIVLGSDIESEAIGLGFEALKGKGGEAGSKLLGKIQANPEYYAESAAAAGVFYYLTFGGGPAVIKGSKIAVESARAARGFQKAEAAGFEAAKARKIEGVTGVRAVMRSQGGLVSLRKSGGVYRTTAPIITQTARGIPKINFGRLKPLVPDAYAIERGTEDVGFIGVKSKQTAIISPALGEKEKAIALGQEITTKHVRDAEIAADVLYPTVKEVPTEAKIKASAVTDVFQSESKVLKKVEPPGIKGKPSVNLGNQLVKTEKGVQPASSRPIGISIISYENKDLLIASKESARRAAQAKRAQDVLSSMPADKSKKTRIFPTVRAATPAKGSKAALETITVNALDRELQKLGKEAAISIAVPSSAAASQSAGGKAIGLGGGASVFAMSGKGTLGLGGATGAEKVSQKNASSVIVEDVELLNPPVPKGSTRPSTARASSLRTSINNILGGQAGKNAIALIGESSKALSKPRSSELTRQTSKLSLTQASSTKVRTGALTVSLTGQATESATSVGTIQTPFQIPVQGTVTIPRPIPPPPPTTTIKVPTVLNSPIGGEYRKKRRRGGKAGITNVQKLAVKNPFGKGFNLKGKRV